MMLSITAALAGDTSEGFTTAQLPFTKQVFHVFTERIERARQERARQERARQEKMAERMAERMGDS